MRKVKIIKTIGMFGRDETADFEEFNLKIGDEISVIPFSSNAVLYQPIKSGDSLFIYTWNIQDITNESNSTTNEATT